MYKLVCCACGRDTLRELLHALAALECADELSINAVSSPEQLKTAVDEQTDILICDVELDHCCGISAVREIKQRYPHIGAIFIVSAPGHCEAVHAVNHEGLLRRPIEPQPLQAAVLRAGKYAYTNRGRYLLVRAKSFTATVFLRDILHLEAADKQVNIITEHSFYSQPGKGEAIFAKLDGRFTQYAKDCYLNMEKLSVLNRSAATLTDGTELRLERAWYAAVRDAYETYLKEQEASPDAFVRPLHS